MQPVYIINDVIYFCPEKKKLSIRRVETKEITLTQPAARCLEILLKTDGIVLQKELYDFAWGENGRNVSPNTLYQNISLIRRGLNQLQPEAGRWVITVPRKGFKIEQSITLVHSDDESPPQPEPTEAVKRLPGETDAFSALSPLLKPCLLVLPIALLLLFIFFILPVNTDVQTTINNYHKLEDIGECQLYVYKEKKVPLEAVNNMVHNYIDCLHYPYVYIVHNQPAKNIVLVSCQNPLTHDESACPSL
ncbi:MAG: winged helix-turn-helix domain-containing protein [Mixta calida]|uniref:OmpR/PhoB-type domain-containing protein n=3 Tax=Mixta TaxID=2100764 RepID=A0ABM6RXN5_9GAMM|nr:winged helix-turn-helix domain-containing protein [Mixta calida]AUY23691.1 hypothetical protein C2E16_01390 [Mixta calida]KAF0861365.1 hypothetical protein Y888_01770 [Mixta calida B021323]MDU2732955.1 winged helix-turn-helix domain-containing protein [Mixta calida]MDU3074994.1 winged helix-turn-helix domain-containing protein [Mixta calida]MDU4288929.1 winged helix-turn-helix domain-containing protein [Mixta calida]